MISKIKILLDALNCLIRFLVLAAALFAFLAERDRNNDARAELLKKIQSLEIKTELVCETVGVPSSIVTPELGDSDKKCEQN